MADSPPTATTEGTTTQASTPGSAGTGWVMPPPSIRRPSRFRSAATRARWLLWLLVANAVGSIVAVGISLWGKTLIGDFESGAATIADLDRFDSVHGLIGLAQTILFLAAGIAWLAWSSRTIDNEDALGIGPSKVGPLMAMVWWFVPLANLVMVPATHADMYRRYHRGVGASAAIVYAWFLLYLVNNLVTSIAGLIWVGADDLAEVQSGLDLWIASDLATAVAAIVAIVMVRRIQNRADLLAAIPPPAAPGTAPEPAGPIPPAPSPAPAPAPAFAPDEPR